MSVPFPILPVLLPELHEGVVTLDRNGEILLCNDSGARILRTDEEAEGKGLIGWEFSEASRLPGLSSLVEEALFDREEFRGEITNDKGSVRRVRVAVLPIAKKGKTTGAVVLLLDRTEVWRLERIRQDFVANVSHELRTPIAAIRGWSETLASDAFDIPDFVRTQLGTIQRHSDRLTALVNDLLVLAKAESVGLDGQFERVSIRELIDEVIRGQAEKLRKKPLTIEVSVEDQVAEVWSAPRALEYILRNLVENAIKYSHKDGRVTVKVQKKKKGRLHLVVRDEGAGISKEHLPRLFERFYRVDAGRSRQEGGTGLGLAIVKHFASALGGDVRVSSEEGSGAEFVVRIPRESWQLPS
ncbi:MAG: two-component system phosphate regulon sensor histidine kinase PhoR [Bradymonadia bacterium]|jgi:two-component system phosphate regulon sensor histidine kinase PhoR